MFVFSVKKRQVKLALLITVIAVMCIVLAVLSKDAVSASKTNIENYRATTNEERIAYLSQFGWEAEEEPVEVCEVVIPQTFNDVYTQYNELQKAQNFDLSLYAGKRVKRWSYRILNHKDYENTDLIRANILVYDGKVIGGDICSVELNGFMHGFVREDKE